MNSVSQILGDYGIIGISVCEVNNSEVEERFPPIFPPLFLELKSSHGSDPRKLWLIPYKDMMNECLVIPYNYYCTIYLHCLVSLCA